MTYNLKRLREENWNQWKIDDCDSRWAKEDRPLPWIVYLVYSELVSETLLPLVTSRSPLDHEHPINITELQIVFP